MAMHHARTSRRPRPVVVAAIALLLTGSGCSGHAKPPHPASLLHADAAAGELAFTELVPTIPGSLMGGPAGALSLDDLRRKALTTDGGAGHFMCQRSGTCLSGLSAPAGSLLLVMTPTRVSCQVPTAYHVRLTGAHALTVTVESDSQCSAPSATAAQGAAALIAVPLRQLPVGKLTIKAPGSLAEPQTTTVDIPAQ